MVATGGFSLPIPPPSHSVASELMETVAGPAGEEKQEEEPPVGDMDTS